jgi:predicted lipid-binding transport protein (Tim44 family)
MQYQIGPPPMNPLMRLLTGLFGLLALIGAFFFGFVLLAVALAVGLVAFVLIQLRVWWLRRKLEASGRMPSNEESRDQGDGSVIDAEYKVVSRKED